MKNKRGFSPILIIVIIAIVAIGGYFGSKMMKDNKQTGGVEINQTTEGSNGSGVASGMAKWLEMAKAGKGIRCTVTNKENNNTTEVYIKGKKMKVMGYDMDEGTKKYSYMINDGVNVYIWAKDEKQGIKVVLPTEEEVKKMTEEAEKIQAENQQYSQDQLLNKYESDQVKNDCREEAVSDSEFIPPTNIEFIDPQQMMKDVQNQMPNVSIPVDMKDIPQIDNDDSSGEE